MTLARGGAFVFQDNMRESWRIGTWLIVRLSPSDEAPPAESSPIDGRQAERWFQWLLEGEPRGRAALLEISEALIGLPMSHRSSPEALLAIVKQGFHDGRLQAFAQRHVGGGKGPDHVDPPRPRPSGPKEETKTFVAIQLTSDDPERRPFAYKRYRVVLPDHSVREGKLDQNGKAEFRDIDPGECEVTFPDLQIGAPPGPT